MKRIAILSDTHGLLREEVIHELKQADAIIHAGDINTQEIIDQMKSYAPLYIVRGNNDKEWAEYLPTSLSVTIEGVTFFVIHNKKDIPKEMAKLPYGKEEIDMIVYGHSHKYDERMEENVYMLNPGSCGKRRFDLEITMCRVRVMDGTFEVEKVVI